MSVRPKCQWYQNSSHVTASVQLKPEATRSKVTADFEENYCAIYDGGQMYWDSHLTHRIVPKKCKLVVKRVRGDMKLMKAQEISWAEFEADPSPSPKKPALEKPDSPDETTTIALEQLDLISEQVEDMRCDLDTRIAIDSQEAELTGAGVAAGDLEVEHPEGEVFFDAMEGVAIDGDPTTVSSGKGLLLELDHLSHDFYDLVNRIKVKVQVAGVVEESCDVKLEETSMTVSFHTSNVRFLSMFPDHTSSTRFSWKIDLFDSIVPASSWFKVLSHCVEVYLTKTSGHRWKNLTSSSHQSSLSSEEGSQRKRTLSEEETKRLKRELLDSISNDRVRNPPLTQPPKPVVITNNTLIESLSSGNVVTAEDRVSQGTSPSPPPSLYSSSRTTPISHTPRSHTPSITSLDPKDPPPKSETFEAALTQSTKKAKNSLARESAVDLFPAPSQPSLVGLVNIGNSCFMNSILQCLSNTDILRDFFLGNHYVSDINRKNPLGFKGDLAQSFAAVIQKLWKSDNGTTFSPRALKAVIAGKSGQFGGYQQQDSHEFMSYLLDGLHEDLNRVKEKPTTAPVESDGSERDPEAVVRLAEKAWLVYRQRNDSYFVDQFQGQFKSTLVCPVCQKMSVTFDPYMSLSVPIPRDMRRLPIFFVPCDPNKCPRKYILELHPDASLELLKASVARKTSILMPQLRVFEVYGGKFHALLSNSQHSIKDIKDNDIIIVSEVLASPSQARHRVVEVNVIQRVLHPPFPKKCAQCRKEGKEKLLRCSKCKAVGYCSSECQTQDWQAHKMSCRGGRPVPIGLPFVISIQRSQLTYDRLAEVAEKFARRSVNVEQVGGPSTSEDKDNSPSSGNAVSSPSKHMYSFVPVDRYGDNKEDAQPIKDLGGDVLQLSEDFLAMDWQNDPKHAHHVKISQKEVLEHKPVQVADASTYQMSSSNHVTLSQCIELLTEPETLSGEDTWFCSKCKSHREATKQISIWRLPHILIIHLKRFSYTGQFNRDKISIKVDYPLEGLDMSSFMPEEAMSLWPEGRQPVYDLYATVNHYGVVYIGHYMAKVRAPPGNKKEWLLYDDERVITSDSDKGVVDRNAYILFYKLRAHKPTSNL